MKPVKYFIGVISKNPDMMQASIQKLPDPWRLIQTESKTFDFNFTDYYKEEMENPLYKKIFLITGIHTEENLSKIKLLCGEIEKKTSKQRKRIVNLDPGYINEGSVVLASTKFASHRIYIGYNIYAEITLYWYKNKYENLPWTYPDFGTQDYKQFFSECRKIFLSEKKALV